MPTDLLRDLQATLGAGFRVTGELAGGGMARVFVADEEQLQRKIVVKLLPPDLMAGLSVERFRSEIQHAAKLQHPHIVPVLSAGVIDYGGGTRGPYYTMPFIRGETLRARLEHAGALPAEEVRRILLDVVDALAHAHEESIVHRDIKPDNIFIVGKNALVTDFGVSKALTPSGTLRPVTGVGMTLGTPGYMSPEQAVGDPELDHRTDIYAVGVLGYELLTGRRPFVGKSIQSLLVAQAVETPVPLQQLSPTTPPLLAAIVMRCLEKRPEDRYETAQTLLTALETVPSVWTTTTPIAVPLVRRGSAPVKGRVISGVAIGLVLVLALVGWRLWGTRVAAPGRLAGTHEASVALVPPELSMPNSAAGAAIAGLMDHISTHLSGITGLKVVSYLSAAELRRGGMSSLREMGRSLGVEHLVVFVPSGGDTAPRMDVRFIEVPTEATHWLTTYVPDSAHFSQIDDDVVSRVRVSLLGPAPPGATAALFRRDRNGSREGAYLAGQRALRHRTPEGIAEAIRYFEEAVRLDSTNAEAFGRLGQALALQVGYGYQTTKSSYTTAALALAFADRAAQLDPDHGDPIAFRAYIEYLSHAPTGVVQDDFERAERHHLTDAAGWHSLELLREGKTEQAIKEATDAIELDPLSSPRHLTLALIGLGARRYELAAREAERAGDYEPLLQRPHQIEAIARLLQGHSAECAKMDLRPYYGVKAICLAAEGRVADARIMVDSLRAALSAGGDPSGYSRVVPIQELAIYFAWTGDSSEALKYLRLAFAESPVGVDQRILKSGVFDRIRQSPGFSEELTRLEASVWPRVLDEHQQLEENFQTTPLAARPRRGGPPVS